MSFSTRVKSEIVKMEYVDINLAFSELTGVFRFSGQYRYRGGNKVYEIVTENAAFARRLFTLVKICYKIHIDIMVRKNTKLNHHTAYIFTVDEEDILDDIYKNMKIGTENKKNVYGELPKELVNEPDKIKAYLRGAFLGSGSISNPEKTYHLELKSKDEGVCIELIHLLEYFSLKGKLIKRKEDYVCYFKDGESIVDFLNVIHAHHALMEIENIRILKEMRNKVNREVNCETANLDKTVNAAVRQMNDIRLILDTLGTDALSTPLYDIAMLRMKNENASLTELGQMLTPPISKSGVNHRMKRIAKIATEIRGGNK